jgi:translation initiation factor 2 alpha subunit (eIF-2alpha)
MGTSQVNYKWTHLGIYLGHEFKKCRQSLQNYRVYRGADFASDHNLVVSKWKLKLVRSRTTHINTPRYNVEHLKDNEKKKTFNLTLEELRDNQDISTESHWQQVKEVQTSLCNEVLGKKERYHKEWLSAASLEKINERGKKMTILNNSITRAAKRLAQENYA